MAVNLAAFRGTVGPKIKSTHPGRGFDKPWLLAFAHILDRMAFGQRFFNRPLGTDERVDLFFDRKDEFAGRVGGMINKLKQETDYPIGDVTFDDSRNQPALQAADLLAYEARRCITEVVLGDKHDKGLRGQWLQLMNAKLPNGTNRIYADYWNAKALRRNVDDISIVEITNQDTLGLMQADNLAVRWLTGRARSNGLT